MSTDPRLLVSTGDLFEWLRPAAFALAALASAWVFARSLGRALPVYAALACALAALVLPLVFLPLFLAFLVFTNPRAKTSEDDTRANDDTTNEVATTNRAPDTRPETVSEQPFSHQTRA
ncbi:MAG TPA: hypothetical protein VEQ42_14045, partial [Pyrinomonadaceae bacterium]|nr:hypothetical protein [Pyrinomonadaceae bacterium]